MKNIFLLLSILLPVLLTGQTESNTTTTILDNSETKKLPRITFLELGSKTCIPCKMMVPVMEEIEAEFGDQVAVIFHDVKKDRKISKKYKIKLIPTQIFLDAEGEELFRHEGFFSTAEISEFLIKQGLTPKTPMTR